MTELSKTEHGTRCQWGAFIAIALTLSSVLLLVPLSFLGNVFPSEFWVILLLPHYCSAYDLFLKNRGVSAWPMLTLVIASAWYVWFAWLSMLVEPAESDVGYIIGWSITGMITPLVLWTLVDAIYRNRLLFILCIPLVAAMCVGCLHFLSEFIQLIVAIM